MLSPFVDLSSSRNVPTLFPLFYIEPARLRLGQWPPEANLKMLPFVDKPREILVAELIPFFGFFAKRAPLCCC
jgi:hypothetical protein